MGSRSKINLAYISGFLDGDGSLMLQIKSRKDGKNKLRFMATICFYQDSRHIEDLVWIRDVLGIGYLSKRNDGISELRINGFKQVKSIIDELIPYVRFKRNQAIVLSKALDLLISKRFNKLNERELRILVDYINQIQNYNYQSKQKRTRKELLKILGLTP